jgi:hypothetical protein
MLRLVAVKSFDNPCFLDSGTFFAPKAGGDLPWHGLEEVNHELESPSLMTMISQCQI